MRDSSAPHQAETRVLKRSRPLRSFSAKRRASATAERASSTRPTRARESDWFCLRTHRKRGCLVPSIKGAARSKAASAPTGGR